MTETEADTGKSCIGLFTALYIEETQLWPMHGKLHENKNIKIIDKILAFLERL